MSSPAERVIDAFGGLTRLARAVGSPVSTVQGWKERGEIPQRHWYPILEAAEGEKIDIALADFLSSRPSQPERAA